MDRAQIKYYKTRYGLKNYKSQRYDQNLHRYKVKTAVGSAQELEYFWRAEAWQWSRTGAICCYQCKKRRAGHWGHEYKK